MPYVPPKYPAEIPTVEDLPDRNDDVDWLYADRYNELKKELRAALTELGTLPKGGHADVKTRLDALGVGFVDRGDPAAHDWTEATLTTDAAWHDLDLSGIVPVGTKAVLLTGWLVDDLVGQHIIFREKGNVNMFNVCAQRTQVANIAIDLNLIVACDVNRIIEYTAANTVFSAIKILVAGWWK